MTITFIIKIVTYPIAVVLRYLFWFLIYANWDDRMFRFCWNLFEYLYKLSPTWNDDTEWRLYRRCSSRFFRPFRYRYRLREGFDLLKQLPTTPVRYWDHMPSDTFYLYRLYRPTRFLRLPSNMSFLARGIALFYYGFSTEYYAQYSTFSELHRRKVGNAERALNKLFNLDQKFRKYFKK